MKAKISNLSTANKVSLEDCIPLDTPFIIQLEPAGFCNLKCVFCPVNAPEHSHHFKRDMMSFEVFKKVVDDVLQFPQKPKVLRLIGNGEPLMNKQLSKMVAYAKEKSAFEKIEITTNATLLNPEMSKNLINAGLDILKISLEAIDDDSFLEISKVAVNVEKLKENIRYFYENRNNCIVYIKTTDLALKNEEMRKRYYNEFGDICDNIFIENVVPIWPEFGDNLQKNGQSRYSDAQYSKVCVQPFKLMQVMADGEVFPCCADWKRKLSIGNINSKSLSDIWNGEKLLKLRVALLKENKENLSPCDVCNHHTLCDTDNIDNKRAEICERLLK